MRTSTLPLCGQILCPKPGVHKSVRTQACIVEPPIIWSSQPKVLISPDSLFNQLYWVVFDHLVVLTVFLSEPEFSVLLPVYHLAFEGREKSLVLVAISPYVF